MRLIGLIVLAGSLALAPLTARAQVASKVHRVAYLGNSSAALESDLIVAFRQGLRELKHVEGQNLIIDFRWAEGRYERFPTLLADAIRLNPDVIVTAGTPGALAAKNATSTIPIVMAAIGDPIAAGLVPSLACPAGNITESASMSPETDGKRLELLKELVPRVSRIAVLWSSTNPNNAARIKDMQAAAQTLRLTLDPLVDVGDSQQFEKGFGAIVAARAEALIMVSDRALLTHRARIIDFAVKRRLPALYPYLEFVEAGGLVSYAPSYLAMFRRTAAYVDKILRGAKPADLPVEQPTKFELVINLKTAKALGLTIPQSLLLRADQVIQ
jgi:putative tryptophan/tyrosine transport system substrate-binding protein